MSIYPDSIENDIATLMESSVSIDGVSYSASVSDVSKSHTLDVGGFFNSPRIRVLMRASSWPNGAPALNKILTYNGAEYRIETSRKDTVCVYVECTDKAR